MILPDERAITNAVGPLIDQARTHGVMESARMAQAKLNALRAAGASEESILAVESLMHELFNSVGLVVPAEPLKTVPDLQRETLASLSLYIGRYEWTQLMTEQKECLADAIDAEFGGDPDLDLVDRWWRD